MKHLPFVALILVGLPLLEIAGFVIVGSQIGVLWTIALVVLSSILGSILLRIQGLGALTRIRLRNVSPDNLSRLAAVPWVARIEAMP